MTSWDLAAIAAILLLGVPHGGLDGVIARRAGWPPSWVGRMVFFFTYSLVAIFVLLLWLKWPAVTLALFLAISAFHFGRSDVAHSVIYPGLNRSRRFVAIAAHGGLVPIAIASLQSALVEPIFSILVGDSGALVLMALINQMFIPWLALLVLYVGQTLSRGLSSKPLLALLALTVFAAIMPPLVTFAIYFCVWHSSGHISRIWQSITERSQHKSALREAVLYTVMAWVAMVIFFVLVNGALSEELMRLTFIGLAALTVPHMLLVDLADEIHRGAPYHE